MSYQDIMISQLPDSYVKDRISNNYYLFQCVTPEFDLIKKTCEELRKSLDLEYAYGGTLDKIGRNVNQVRGSTTDIVLRTLIKAKIAADMSEGTIKTLLDVIGFIVGDETGQSRIDELYNIIGEGQEPAAFQIVVPIEGIIDAGITVNQFVQLMVHIKAAGVRIYADLQGTFEFGEITEYGFEYDTGFADIDQTIGGSIGILYDPENDDPLPI